MDLAGLPKSPEDTTTDYHKMTKEAQARAEYQQTLENLQNPPSLRELQMKREQELENERRSAAERAAQLEDAARQKTEQERQEAAAAAEAERQRREEAEQKLQEEKTATLMGQIDALRQEIQRFAAGAGTQRSIIEQLKELRESAAELGLVNPGVSQDANLQLEIAKINLQSAREEREFKRLIREDEKKWTLELQKLNDERDFKKQELAAQERKDEMIANFPKAIGSAIAQGLLARGEGGEVSDGTAPVSKPVSSQPQAPIEITAYEGEFGEFDCPVCKTKVGVGPSATASICAKCQQQFVVKRTAAPENPPLPDEEEESRRERA